MEEIAHQFEPPQQRAPRPGRSAAIARLVAVIVLSLLLLVGDSDTPPAALDVQALASTTLQILRPAQQDIVPTGDVLVCGTVQNLPRDTMLWTLISSGGFYWPQRPITRVGDSWVGQVRVGNSPQNFDVEMDVVVFAVDHAASDAFWAWIVNGHARADVYEPYVTVARPLPSGVHQLATVRVVSGRPGATTIADVSSICPT
jgi:hypothetical protein